MVRVRAEDDAVEQDLHAHTIQQGATGRIVETILPTQMRNVYSTHPFVRHPVQDAYTYLLPRPFGATR